MNSAVERWKSRLAALEPEERAELVDFLESLQPMDREIEAEQQVEAARRVDEIRSGRVIGRPAEEVLAELRTLYPPAPRDVATAMEILRSFRRRKRMYLMTVDLSNVQSFLTGFQIGGSGAGLQGPTEYWYEASERRGWGREAMGPIPPMREKGLDDEAIADELIEIEILALQFLAGDGPRADG